MFDILEIPASYRVHLHRTIPLEKIYSDCKGIENQVKEIRWYASYAPKSNIPALQSGSEKRHDEIQFISVELLDPNDLYAVCVPIFKQIKYQVLICLKYQGKFVFSACRFQPGDKDWTKNVLGTVLFSHWIYPDMMSDCAKKFIEELKAAITPSENIENTYKKICEVILDFWIGGITGKAVSKILYDMISQKTMSHLLDNCTPYKVYQPKSNTKYAKYQKRDEMQQYSYRYDLEDLWYALMKNERTRRVIEGRGYKDVNEMVSSILSK